jgi:hypothetical protein
MNVAVLKALPFTADFENSFAWFVDRAGLAVAWRFQRALAQPHQDRVAITNWYLGRKSARISGLNPACLSVSAISSRRKFR